jgi:hypothetical protein
MESDKGEYDKPHFACFGYPQGWAIKKIWLPANRHDFSDGDRGF